MKRTQVRFLVPALATAIVASLAPSPAAAEPGQGFVRPVSRPVPAVPVSRVAPAPVAGTTAMKRAADRPKPVWPTAGSAVVDLPAAPAQAWAGREADAGAAVPAGQLPVSVAAAGSLRRVRVEVLDRPATARAQVAGVLFRVSPPAGRAATGDVVVNVDYRSFANAYGGDWSSRLRLVALPECALTRPGNPECAGRPLPSSNNLATGTVSAKVRTASGAGLMSLVAGPSGPGGDYRATSLQASSTWSAGGNSGAFTWSYPMRVPPATGGPAPGLGLSYSSQSVDGRHAASNNQPSWVGEGFEFTPGGFIERRYKACAQDMGGDANNGTATGDLCWETDNATLTMDGHSGELIYNPTEGRWHLRGDDGSRVQRFTGAANGDNDGEYWVVTTTDGRQYWFGRNRLPGWASGDPETDSVWTAPVFGNDSDEPCHATGFADSDCVQAWRWNLDYVVDLSDNSASFWYLKETNRYGRDNDHNDAAPYERGGYLSHIAYGTRVDRTPEPDRDTVLSAAAPMKVAFAVADRCLADCGDHGAPWPDTPWDNDCAAAPCAGVAPTFWTTRRLSTVTTQVWGGSGYLDVERWTFNHTFPDPGDGSRAGLWLSRISHAGLVGTVTTVPDLEFTGTQMPNRVDATGDFALAMNWYRVSTIRNETGGTISVNYSAPDCVAGQPMPEPHNNTRRCYPVRWTPQGYSAPVTDWFHKYVVTSMYEDAHTGGAPPAGSPRTVYQYSYLGGAAWHYTDEDGLIDPENKTWSGWRGYGRVGVTVGDPGEQMYTESVYLRGMHADRQPSGTRTVLVPATGVADVADEDAYAGMQRESTVFNGPGGVVVSRTVTEPWQSAPTATRTIGAETVHSRFVGTAATHERVTVAGGPDRVATVTTAFDGYGLPVAVDDLGDAAVTGDETCTRTTYEPRNTTGWLIGAAHRVQTYAVACAATAGPLGDADVIGETHTSYDGQVYGSMPIRGLVTRTEELSTWNSGAPTFVTSAQAAYDAQGRQVQARNGVNALTTTAYTPSVGGPVTATTVTNALNHVTTSTVNPAWGSITSIVDPNGRRTDVSHDGFGRLTAVWLPNRDKATESANQTFAYLIRNDAASVVSTSRLNGSGGYVTTREFFDGLLRTRQTQTPSPAGGRLLTDSFYDSAGRSVRSYGAYHTTGAPDTTLVTATQAIDVPNQTRTTYDGAGRLVRSDFEPYGVTRWSTITAYTGDRVDVTPPAGGTATSTRLDARGRTVELRQYQAPTPTGGYDSTTYTFNRKNQLAQVTDPAGNSWSYGYDLRGRQTSSTHPDKGTTVLTYDNANRVTSSTDARNQKLVYGYDLLDRKRIEWETAANGTVRAQWIYDTVAKGQLSQRTRFADGGSYQVKVTGYTDLYQPVTTQVVIPATETGLSGTYAFTNAWSDVDGSLLSSTLPDTNADLPAETLSYGYDALGRPTTVGTQLAPSTNLSLVNATAYNALGLIDQITLDTDDTAGGRAYLSYTRELDTNRVTGIRTDRDSVSPYTVADLRYSYDAAGNIGRIADVAVEDDTQCFRYDYLRRLTDAWTPSSSDCAGAPTSAALGGPAPYRYAWTIDKVGNRQTHTSSAAGTATTDYVYPLAGTAQPHTLSATTGARVGAYTYDAAGNTTCRPTAGTANNCTTGAGSQLLTWDVEGHLATSADAGGTTTYVYDADGNRLIRRDPTGKTLYLPGQEIRFTTGTADTAATRYYPFAGQTVASRTAAGLSWLTGDQQGTAQVAIDQASQATSIRRQTPFGQSRGTAPAWPNAKGFVGGTVDNTGLTHLGAREYDPAAGRFLSVDPIHNQDDPQQWNSYAYSNNSPVTFSDPSGLEHDAEGGPGTSYEPQRVDNGGSTGRARDENPRRTDCHSMESCPLNAKEQAQKEAADEMLRTYGSDPEVCVIRNLYCRSIADLGPHERAWCHMVGNLTCLAAKRAKEKAESLIHQPEDVFDPEWNALHHGLFMALMVVYGVSPDEALMLGVAHELASPGFGFAPPFGSVDSRIDMHNNEIGIAIAHDVLQQDYPAARPYLPMEQQESAAISAVMAAASPSCVGALCLDRSAR